jgi:hypothetical protein
MDMTDVKMPDIPSEPTAHLSRVRRRVPEPLDQSPRWEQLDRHAFEFRWDVIEASAACGYYNIVTLVTQGGCLIQRYTSGPTICTVGRNQGQHVQDPHVRANFQQRRQTFQQRRQTRIASGDIEKSALSRSASMEFVKHRCSLRWPPADLRTCDRGSASSMRNKSGASSTRTATTVDRFTTDAIPHPACLQVFASHKCSAKLVFGDPAVPI